ncbi:DUF2339 domain-containing protein [Pseudochryseolinea flava]|uniref:DUF2339 domain-containing protein n=1 Tax=Pseudochryseolinea flava TaxID=2059302 RepID=A0A364Y487_9BACT|nr:DUF2339 domain-containing protein [Pseudochryseolinea flava]RAW01633.1 DUF2339 domain-containing protein [Pseudochryseolinea flava]
MDELQRQKLKDLTDKVDILSKQQEKLAFDITQIRQELKILSTPTTVDEPSITVAEKTPEIKPIPVEEKKTLPPVTPPPVANKPAMPPPIPTRGGFKPRRSPDDRNAVEEFIGTNILNKIGIAAVVIGLGIGAKYAIDLELINEVTRIILGYVAGGVLIALAMRLKPNPKYLAFSAVLLSGGMATLYFMTFAAYAFYDLIPQAMAFVLMVVFTGFTVFAALQYDMKVIAIIGLVGAYAVPFMLSDGSGRVHILFSYMTIINIGILILSFKKAWKVLYYIAFGLTWLIYMAWFAGDYDPEKHIVTGLLFSTLFFATFYTTFLAYKLVRKESLNIPDVILLAFNTFLYYGFGYAAIDMAENGELYLGLFTVFNALLHFVACLVIHKRQEGPRETFYLLAGMVLVFLTLAVPVQFEGSWVTLIWALEAALMFWIGRTKNLPIYEKISYGLVVLTFVGLLYDWQMYYMHYEFDGEQSSLRPFFNISVLSSLLVVASWGAILYIKDTHPTSDTAKNKLLTAFNWIVPIFMGFVLFCTFYQEIDAFWSLRYHDTAIKPASEYDISTYNDDYLYFNTLSSILYAALFMISLWLLNRKWFHNKYVDNAVLAFNMLIIVSFLTGGVNALYELRSSYLYPSDQDPFIHGAGNIVIRYISLVIILPLLWINYSITNDPSMDARLKNVMKVFSIFVVLIILSSEMISLLDHASIENSDRLALSLLWSVYAFALIAYGLKKDIKLIRIVAIVIFGITIIKLFLYDDLSAVGNTVVLIILGVLLLVASFIYNKLKKTKNEA